MLAVQDKTVFDNYISGGIAEDQLPKDVVDAIGGSTSASSMAVDEKEEPSDFVISAALSAPSSHMEESEAVSLIMGRERSVHTSKSILVAPSKDFKSLFTSATESKAPAAAPVRPAHDRYQQRPEQDYYRNIGLGTEDIDTRGSMFLGAQERSAPAASGSTDRARESSSSASRERRSGSTSEATEAKRPKAQLKPIIIIPGAASSPINRWNMQKFFGEGVFEAIDPNDPNLDDSAPHKIEFMRVKENGEQVPYEVVDSTAKFTPADWERVISIFTIGKVWQFKAYTPYKDDRIADMFQKHCGIYVRLGTEKIPQDTIVNWKVKTITVSKSHRHNDAATLREFWDTIDLFVKTNKINHLRA